MPSIPASQIVSVTPSVLSAGGNALVMNGVILTENTRVPTGVAPSFPSALAVATYFGVTSTEAAMASTYFLGYANGTQTPGSLLFYQYNENAVAAYLRGAPLSGFTVATLQAITSASMTIFCSGATYTASAVNLSGATSFSAAAALVQAALQSTEPTEATFTGAIAPAAASVTGSISDGVMTVTAVSSGTLLAGGTISGTGVTAGTIIVSQLSGTAGGIGTYSVSITEQSVVSTTITQAAGLLTVSAVASGTLSVGQVLTGTGVTAGTLITALGSGTGLTGTYVVSPSQTVASETLTALGDALLVTYDSVSNAFVITSSVLGAASTIAFPTGTLATALLLTSAAGAVLSQGAAAQTEASSMNALVAITTNWASFATAFEPVLASKLAFAAWNNAQNNRYLYVQYDSDVTPTLSNAAVNSFGYLIGASGSNYSGVMPVETQTEAAFALGIVASINFGAINGRTTLAFQAQSGILPSVTNATIAQNLIANGYNFYGQYSTANQSFDWLYPGQISGPFKWADSYVNQIWMNNQFQLALMTLLGTVGSIPYNPSGYALVAEALGGTGGPIQAAITFGAIQPNVPLSSVQIAAVNQLAGIPIDGILSTRGWYLQIQAATPQVRAARSSPPCLFWYMDGGSIQQLNLASVEIQ